MRIALNGEQLTLDPSGALYWPAERTLVFADLHFEKGSAFARRGQFLPPYDTRETIARMRAAIEGHHPERVIALGDSFHDMEAAERLDSFERDALRALSAGRTWIWIEGNHDPSPPRWLGGVIASEIAIGGLVFRHAPSPAPQPGEIVGHLHPCASVRGLRRRCFVSDGTRMVLPAFGAYAGGLDVRERAIAGLFPQDYLAYLLGTRRVYAVATCDGAYKFWRNTKDESQPISTAITTADTP